MEILPGVHRIANAVSTAYVLIAERDGLTIIDSGPPKFDRTIVKYLRQIGRRPDEVQRIILTHRHFDHMGGAAGLRAATGARVWAHPLDAAQISGASPYQYPKGGVGTAMRLMTPIFFPMRSCQVDESLVPDQEIALGDLGTLRVIFTPGHTLGHCSLILPSRRLAILGDALNNFSGKPSVPPPYLNDDDTLAQQTGQALASLDVDALVFGHGNPILKEGSAALHAVRNRTV